MNAITVQNYFFMYKLYYALELQPTLISTYNRSLLSGREKKFSLRKFHETLHTISIFLSVIWEIYTDYYLTMPVC